VASVFIEVGGESRPLEPFSTGKVGQMIRLASQLGKEWASIQNAVTDYRRKYGEENKVVTTRDMVFDRMEYCRDMLAAATTDEAKEEWTAVIAGWQRRLDGPLKDKDQMELPGEPTGQEVAGAVVPTAFEEAEPLIIGLLGLIVAKDADLKKAFLTGNLSDVVQQQGVDVYFNSTPDEAMEIIHQGLLLFLGDSEARKDRAGKLRDAAMDAFGVEKSPETQEPTPEVTETTTETSGSVTPETDSKNESSTDSQPTTTGTSEPSFTGSHTVESVA
jgi:hypothetical protein